MASMNLSSGVLKPSFCHRRLRRGVNRPNPNQAAPPRMDSRPSVYTPSPLNLDRNKNNGLFSENLDDWIRGSAAEIVKNLRKAPLLVHVHASDDGTGTRLETEKAIAEDWSEVTRRWKDGESPSPDGLVFVEELTGGEYLGEEERETRAWGIVVQGKGAECGPACYLLKTCRVGSGLGLDCTHFCLTKVRDFRESALSQLNNCWLLK